ncbi:phosphoribosyltransferase [Patescibacteria group bacterium]
MIFRDRQEGGQKLISEIEKYKGNPNAIILGLPRGGVVTAFEISSALNLPLDIIAPRKISAPGAPELAIGAITEDGELILNESVKGYKIDPKYLETETENQKKEAERRLKVYRGERPPLILKDKIAIIVDDGVATGATMRAAIRSAKKSQAKKIVVAIPVIAQDSLEIIKNEVDEMIFLDAPPLFGAVGAFYENFSQTEDAEVIQLLNKQENQLTIQ